jgi:SAM-dependent methyltransferase
LKGNVVATTFEGRQFVYRRCVTCRSLACDPMPDASILARMYKHGYLTGFSDPYVVDDADDYGWLSYELRSRRPGVILDFGCGAGTGLGLARNVGWTAVGAEFDPAVAREIEQSTGFPVKTPDALGGPYDAIHFGDVIEHLTDPLAVVETVLATLRPDGVVLARGPLEANPSVFTLGLAASRRLRGTHAGMPPYHVIQATAVGQRAFFERAGLVEQRFDVLEHDWPAPSRLRRQDLRNPRTVGLFTLRRASRIAKAMTGYGGSRFRYVGST